MEKTIKLEITHKVESGKLMEKKTNKIFHPEWEIQIKEKRMINEQGKHRWRTVSWFEKNKKSMSVKNMNGK